MKTNFSKILLSFLVILIMVSCKKDIETNSSTQNPMLGKNQCYDIDEEAFLIDESDLEDQDLNYANYYMAYVFQNVFESTPQLVDELKSRAEASVFSMVSIYELEDDFPDITPSIKFHLGEVAELDTTNLNWHAFIDSLMLYDSTQYAPFIFLVNEQTCEITSTPYFGTDAYVDEVGDYAGLEDHIPVWYTDGNGCHFKTMGEHDAYEETHPLFNFVAGIIGVDDVNPETPVDLDYLLSGEASTESGKTDDYHSTSTDLVPRMVQEKFKIMEAYERPSSKIDYAIERKFHCDVDGGVDFPNIELTNYANVEPIILKLNHADVGTDVEWWKTIIPGYAMQKGYDFYTWAWDHNIVLYNAIATVERDWASGYKIVGYYQPYDLEIPFTTRMKHESDWYHFKPIDNIGYKGINSFVELHPDNWDSQHWVSPKGGYINIWRIDP